MSAPSKWPLPANGSRFLTPAFMLKKLAQHPLTRECYPTALGYYPSAADHRMERRRHDDNLLIYCVEGAGHARTDGWRGQVSPGQIMLLPQGDAHRYEADARDPWSIYWLHFQGSSSAVFNQYLAGPDPRSPVVDIGVSPQLAGLFQGLLNVRRTGYSTRAFINAANQLRHLLTTIGLMSREARAGKPASLNLEELHSFMLENIGRPLDLDTLAAAANLSKYHFCGKYRALTGYSPMKHFTNMKMEHACQLLDTSQMSVKEVASSLGYDDQLYFSRVFNNTVGMSPRAYRSSVRN